MSRFESGGGVAFEVNRLNVWYGQAQALKDITLSIPARQITAVIGPSGCGKSTLSPTTCSRPRVYPT